MHDARDAEDKRLLEAGEIELLLAGWYETIVGRCVARMRVVDEKNAASPVTTLAAWTVESGHPGAQRGA